MLGLFQADLPFGRRLFVIFLTLLIFQRVPSLPPSFLIDPMSAASDILLFFGCIFILAAMLRLPILFAAAFARTITERRIARTDVNRSALELPRQFGWSEMGYEFADVGAALLAAPYFGSEWVSLIGRIGLVAVLATLLWHDHDSPTQSWDVLELRERGALVTATFLPSGGVVEVVHSNLRWLEELSFVASHGWELLGIGGDHFRRTATFRRRTHPGARWRNRILQSLRRQRILHP